MKKWIITLCICFVVAGFALLIAGNLFVPAQEYTTYLVDYSQGVNLGYRDDGFETNVSMRGEIDVAEQVTVDFNGETYTGKFFNTSDDWRYPYAYDNYIMHDKNKDVNATFYVVRGSNRLWKFYNTPNEQEKMKPVVSDPEATALNIATDYAKSHIMNLAGYEMSIEERRKLSADDVTVYEVTFMHKADGYNTEDYITVYVSDRGTLLGFLKGNLGSVVGRGIRVDEQMLNESLENSLFDRYERVSLGVEKYDIAEQELIALQDGRIGMYTLVHVWDTNPLLTDYAGVCVLTVIGELPWKGYTYLGIGLLCVGAVGALLLLLRKKRNCA